MPIFRRIAALTFVAALAGAALTGVLSAQTGPAGLAAVRSAAGEDGSSPRVQRTGHDGDEETIAAAAAPDAFSAGLAAYRAGNIAEAVSQWQIAADSGHVGAQWNLARIFASPGTRDPRRWIHYLRLAAGQYDPDAAPGPRAAVTLEALIELGRVYWLGDAEASVAPEPRRAFAIFEHTATLFGHPRAQHYLGLMYLRGEGVKQDIPRAIRWLFLAARKQYAPSQAALGDYFWQRGAGQPSGSDDRLRGLMWFALASQHAKGEELRARFHDRYEEAAAEVTSEERDKVASLVDGWNARNPRTLAQATQ